VVPPAQNPTVPPNPSVLTWVQVVDDVVKIGLGALVAGLFAWLVARHGSKSAIQKLQFERRSKILSDVAQTYEAYFQAFYKFHRQVVGLSQLGPNREALVLLANAPASRQFFEDTWSQKRELDEKLREIFTAQSQLMLLGEAKSGEAAKGLVRAIADALQSLGWDGYACKSTLVQEIANPVTAARESFYKEMRLAFDRSV